MILPTVQLVNHCVTTRTGRTSTTGRPMLFTGRTSSTGRPMPFTGRTSTTGSPMPFTGRVRSDPRKHARIFQASNIHDNPVYSFSVYRTWTPCRKNSRKFDNRKSLHRKLAKQRIPRWIPVYRKLRRCKSLALVRSRISICSSQ